MAKRVGGPVGEAVGLHSYEFLLHGERAECDQELSFGKQGPQTLLKAAVVLAPKIHLL